MKRVNIGVVGCGNISNIYFENLTKTFVNTTVYACGDLEQERARGSAEKWGIPNVLRFEEMLQDDQIEIILNITTPKTHFEICKRALEAGKHVYVEKPLSLSLAQALELVQLAKKKKLLLGCAPDTFMGGGIQTCRKLIDDGFIGAPTGAAAFMVCHGHESWHPDPEFYYKAGGGPMLDMGPYYLSALVSLLGGVATVCGMTNKAMEQRMITSEKKYGSSIDVEVPTHVTGSLLFENNAVATIITSFDVWHSTLPRIEIYGTAGMLSVPDPNTFGGPVMLFTPGCNEAKEIPLTHGYAQNSRGLGVADMARCITTGRDEHIASGTLACHVLEIMLGLQQSGEDKQYYHMKTECPRPQALPMGLIKGYV